MTMQLADPERQRILTRVRNAVSVLDTTGGPDGLEREDSLRSLDNTVRQALQDLAIPLHDCGVNWVDPEDDPRQRPSRGPVIAGGWSQDSDRRGLEVIFHIWETREVAYRPDLDEEDVFSEAKSHAEAYGAPVRAIIDVPFSQGTLAVNSTRPHAFSEAHIVALQALAEALSEGLAEDAEDLAAFEERASEPSVAFVDAVKALKRSGKIESSHQAICSPRDRGHPSEEPPAAGGFARPTACRQPAASRCREAIGVRQVPRTPGRLPHRLWD